MSKSNSAQADHCRVLLEDLKTQVCVWQVQAATSINQERLLPYWYIGKEILARQREQVWVVRGTVNLRVRYPKLVLYDNPDLRSQFNLPHLEFSTQRLSICFDGSSKHQGCIKFQI